MEKYIKPNTTVIKVDTTQHLLDMSAKVSNGSGNYDNDGNHNVVNSKGYKSVFDDE